MTRTTPSRRKKNKKGVNTCQFRFYLQCFVSNVNLQLYTHTPYSCIWIMLGEEERWKKKKTPDEAENGSCLQKDTAISLHSSIVTRVQLTDRQTHRGGDGGGFLPIGHRSHWGRKRWKTDHLVNLIELAGAIPSTVGIERDAGSWASMQIRSLNITFEKPLAASAMAKPLLSSCIFFSSFLYSTFRDMMVGRVERASWWLTDPNIRVWMTTPLSPSCTTCNTHTNTNTHPFWLDRIL